MTHYTAKTLKLALFTTGAVAVAVSAALAAQPAARRVGALTVDIARAGQAPALSCDKIAQQALPQARITSAVSVKAGPFTPPGAAAGARPVDLPAHCRIAATLAPSSDSDIKMELWLPLEKWNGKFMMVGNGGWNGALPLPAMVYDLPANGQRLIQRAHGYHSTVLRGQITFEDGVATGALPGQLVRGQQRAR
jgi:hypothetical protein